MLGAFSSLTDGTLLDFPIFDIASRHVDTLVTPFQIKSGVVLTWKVRKQTRGKGAKTEKRRIKTNLKKQPARIAQF